MSSKYSTPGWSSARRGHRPEHLAGGRRVSADGDTITLPGTAGFGWCSPRGRLFVPFATITSGRYSLDDADRLHRALVAFEQADQAHDDVPFPPGVFRAAELDAAPPGTVITASPYTTWGDADVVPVDRATFDRVTGALPTAPPEPVPPAVEPVAESITETDSIARADLALPQRESDISQRDENRTS